MNCPICAGESSYELSKDGCDYLRCGRCGFLFHRSTDANAGRPAPPTYNDAYWAMERQEAVRRERRDCFLRALELIYVSSIPVRRILDFGCGQGETVRLLRETLNLDAIGIDPFGQFQATEYLHRKDLPELREIYPRGSFDAIYSIEVFEHLRDPKQTLADLTYFLGPGGRMLINTGTQEYISELDPERSYIDPLGRGHISIYSLRSFSLLASSFGFEVRFLAGRRFLLILNKSGESNAVYPLNANLEVFRAIGEWFPVVFGEYMRLLFAEDSHKIELKDRTEWALSMGRILEEKGEEIRRLQHEFEDRSRWALDRDREVMEREAEIVRLGSEFEERSRWAMDLERQVAEQRAEIARLECEVERLDSLSKRSTALNLVRQKLMRFYKSFVPR